MTVNTRTPRLAASTEGALRICGYLRVSTERQVEGDLSIPDQRKQIHAFCAAKGWQMVGEYVEPGASATDDNRPEFQRMIERAGDDDHPYDAVIVHSYSRFFRDSLAWRCISAASARPGCA